MKAVILAAGRGRRLGTLTDEKPKCMVPLGGKPLLHWQRTALRAAGADELAVVTGYRAEALADGGYTTFPATRWENTNMVTSLCAAAPWLRAHACVVAYGDIVYPAAAVRSLAAAPGDVVITYDPHWWDLWSLRFADPLDDAETFRLAGDGTVRRIGGRAAHPAEIEGQYMGLLKFTPPGWSAVESVLGTLPDRTRDAMDMTSLLQLLIDRGHRVHAVPAPYGWAEVDTESDLALYEDLVARGRLALPTHD